MNKLFIFSEQKGIMNKTYNGPQSRLMDTLMGKVEQHGEINCTDQVYLARGCLSVEKEYSILKWTRNIPTENGWYLVYTPDDSHPDFVEIVNVKDKFYILIEGTTLQNIEDAVADTDWWYGPIPQIIEESINSTLM